MGPAAWVWCMDVLLHELETSIPEEMVEITAYADDLACVIKANTRKEITNHGTKLIELINKWCRSHHLRMSTSKTVAMLVKGSMNEKHLPTLKINGKNVKYVNTVKYLGVILDRKLTFVAHARYLRAKVAEFMFSIKRVAAEKWGIKTDILKVLYKAVALPIIKYGAVLWYEEVQKTIVKRNIMALQRVILLLVSRACRTTSTVALQTILGAKPMDLEIIEDALVKRTKRNLSTTWDTYTCMERETEQAQELLSSEIERIKAHIAENWQRRWETDVHGRETFKYIDKVNFVQNNNSWFKINRYATYLITGYGPINSTLNKRGLTESNGCPSCRATEETTEHILFDYPVYKDVRLDLMETYRGKEKEFIRNKETLVKFNEFATSVFKIRQERTERESRGSASPWQGREMADALSDG